MRQPTKDALREQLALAADEIIRLRGLVPKPTPLVDMWEKNRRTLLATFKTKAKCWLLER